MNKDIQFEFSKCSINRSSAERFLSLLHYLVRKLLPNDKTRVHEATEFKLFCYGPAINGTTCQNNIEFSIDVIPTSKEQNSNLSEIEILNKVFEKLADPGI